VKMTINNQVDLVKWSKSSLLYQRKKDKLCDARFRLGAMIGVCTERRVVEGETPLSRCVPVENGGGPSGKN